MPRLVLDNFAGGLNLRDSPNELAPSETPAAMDWTLDQRGAIQWRKGCLNAVALPGVSGKRAFIFYSEALDLWLCARETAGAPNTIRLHTRPGDFSGVWTDRGSLMGGGSNLSMLVGFADWPGTTPMVVIASAGIGPGTGGATQTWDGTTLAAPTGQLAGFGLAVWQNRVWRIGYGINAANGNLTTLFASAIGDPGQWDPASGGLRVDIRDKDASRLTALGIAGGALVVFKTRSAHRVSDSATGAYSTIDASAGCQGANAVVALGGKLYTWGADALYEWDGVGRGRNIGDKARPYFITPTLPFEPPVGGVVAGKLLFCFANDFGTVRDDLLEVHPGAGWLMYTQLQSNTKDEVSSFARKGDALYGAISDGDVIFRMFTETPGADDGVIALFSQRNSYRTPWLEPAQGKLCRIDRAQIEGLLAFGGTTTLVMNVYKDGDLSVSDQYSLSADLRASNANDQLQQSIVRSLGHARSFAFEFVAATAAGLAQVNSLLLEFTTLEG